MVSTPRGGKPFVFVTWVTGLLAGEAQCTYAAWFKSHYRYAKVPDTTFDRTAWTTDHTELVRRRRDELLAEGWRVRLENENAFRLKGESAILAGTPDIIAFKNGTVRVVDAKTGQQRGRDLHQALIYMFAVPRIWPELRDHVIEGEICYRTGPVYIGPHELTPERIAAIGATVKAVADVTEPGPVPSARECALCDLADCTARVESPIAEAAVPELF